jgi:signal transduction histidine kinase
LHLRSQAVRWLTQVYVAWNTNADHQSLNAFEIGEGMEADIVQDLRAKLNVAAEALRKAEERALAGQFALEVMHEIRNPLEAVGYLIHLATQEDDVNTIQSICDRLTNKCRQFIRSRRRPSVSLDCCQRHKRWT